MLEITITGAGSEMQGVGRMTDGRVIFIPGALPGETVLAEIKRSAGSFAEGRLVEVLRPSPDRIEPDCPYYGECGGCAARHMSYAASLELKRQKVANALRRIGGETAPCVFPTIASDAVTRCRNKAEYAVETQDGRIVVGLRMNRSRRVIPVEDCLLQSESSVRALRFLQARLNGIEGARHIRFLVTRTNRMGETTLTFSADAPMPPSVRMLAQDVAAAVPEIVSVFFCRLNPRPKHALDGECTRVCGRNVLCDELLGLTFELSPQAFFQVNPPQAEKLYLKAFEAAILTENARVLDAYCGAGTITLSAARRCASAVGVEIVAPAVENAKRNAQRNGLEGKARFFCGDAAKIIPKLIAGNECFDAVILDPPRKGADAALLNAVADAKIPRIAYISCDPATLARDVKLLTNRDYHLEWAQPMDMFPWTEHVETVVLMSRVNK